MEIKINAIHFDATEKLNDFINKKVDKLGKYNEEISNAEVILKVVKPETAMNKEASVRLNVPRNEDLFANKVADTFEEAIDGLRSAIRLSREIMDDFDPMSVYPFIIGLDLAGEEDAGRPMSDYAEFFMSDEVLGSGLQLFLHCGESLRFDNDSVLDAFLFGAQRLGHAFNLYRYPKVQELLAERGTAIEVCPVSNCLLGYAHDLRLHPGQNYFHEKIPIVLCSDDALYLEDDPLTEDYFAVILAWDLSIAEIRALWRSMLCMPNGRLNGTPLLKNGVRRTTCRMLHN